MTSVCLAVRGERNPEGLMLWLACEPLLLFRHRRGIRPDNSRRIESIVEDDIIQFSRLRLLDDLPRFAEVMQGEQAVAEVLIWADIIRVKAEACSMRLRGLLILPQ